MFESSKKSKRQLVAGGGFRGEISRFDAGITIRIFNLDQMIRIGHAVTVRERHLYV
tara:strand:- start:333 stop:500 length:168 start_codon:yes stop_codon:yes gene_type:complete